MDGYHIIKKVLSIIMVTGMLTMFGFLIRWIAMFLGRNPDKEKRKKTAVVVLIAMPAMVISMVLHLAVSIRQYTKPFDLNTALSFTVTSDNLKDGVWDRQIGAQNGNLSPALSWDAVEGAGEYAIIMLDQDADNWLHWIRTTSRAGVSAGQSAGEKDGYVGPYPPSGTHHYTVYVFALKGECRNLDAKLDQGGLDFDKLVSQINDGLTTDYDNILAIGSITGEYSQEKNPVP